MSAPASRGRSRLPVSPPESSRSAGRRSAARPQSDSPAPSPVRRRPAGGVVVRSAHRLRHGLAAALLALPLLAVFATGAQAQVLVSNIGQRNFGAGNGYTYDLATSFTTGGNSAGYTVTGADIQFFWLADKGASTKATVTIRNSSGSRPGAVVGTLSFPVIPDFSNSNYDQVLSFSHAGLELAPNTKYWLVWDVGDTPLSGLNQVRYASGTNEDAAGADRWSIGEVASRRHKESKWKPTTIPNSIKIRIKGTVNDGDSPSDDLKMALTLSGNDFLLSVADPPGAPSSRHFHIRAVPKAGVARQGHLGAHHVYVAGTGFDDTRVERVCHSLGPMQGDYCVREPVDVPGGRKRPLSGFFKLAPGAQYTVTVEVRRGTTPNSRFLPPQGAVLASGSLDITVPGAMTVPGAVPTTVLLRTPHSLVVEVDESWRRAGDESEDYAFFASRPSVSHTVRHAGEDNCDNPTARPGIDPWDLTLMHSTTLRGRGPDDTIIHFGHLGDNPLRYCGLKPDTEYLVVIEGKRKVSKTGGFQLQPRGKTLLYVRTLPEGGGCNPCMSERLPTPEASVAGPGPVTEGADAVFTVSVDPPVPADVEVTLDVEETHGSGAKTVAHVLRQTLVIPAGQSSATYTHATHDDGEDLGGGSITVSVAAGTGYTVSAAAGAVTVALIDDDAPAEFVPDATLLAEVEALAEKHRDSNPDAHERLTKVLKGMTGEDGGYTAAECRAESRRHGASVEKRWTPWCDEIARREAHEANAKQQPPPPTPEISIAAGAGVTEGTAAAFTLTAAPVPAAPLTVDVTVTEAGGYATAGAQQVTIPTSGTATLTIATTGDDVDEPDGSVTAALAAGQGYTVSANAGAATVAVVDDDDPAPPAAAFVPDAALVAEVEALAARLKGSNANAHARVMKVLKGLKGEDGGYTAAECRAESRKHGAGVEQRWKPWCDEIARREAHGTTTVQPAPTPPAAPEISIAGGAGVTEGGDASFTLTADPAPSADLAVAVTVSEKAGSDYVAAANEGSRTVTILAGQAQAAFTVATVDDGADEPDGSVTATLGTGTGYTLAASPGDAATVAVADNDAASSVLSLSVDDATAREDAGYVRFTVRLSKPAARVVYARFSTRESDPVSARQGVDYKGWTGGFVVIPRGGIEATIPVRIFDDGHDEGSETFDVVLSGPGGAAIADGVAVGTIVNADPMPAAWLARFGRTVAEQALEGISGRMAADRTPGMRGSLGGQAIAFNPWAPDAGPSGAGAADETQEREAARALTEIARGFDGGSGAGPGSGSGTGDRFGAGLARGFDDPQARQSQTMTGRELLLGSSFTLTGETDPNGGTIAFWGRAAQGAFDGKEGDISLDGEVTTAMLGADYARERWLLGLALTQSAGEGGWRGAGATGAAGMSGKVESTLTAAIPYGALQASERLKLWGAAGYGTGEVTLMPEAGGERLTADTRWTMAALGARGDLLAPGGNGPALALVSDALWARTASEKVRGMAASESDVTRLRLGLEGGWQVALEGGGSLTPRLELGARHDGGDAETGFGVELGGGLAWTDPKLGLSLDVSGRTLIAHEADGLGDRGYAASVAFDPDPASDRGLSLKLGHDMGGQAEGGLDALFADDPLADRTGSEATGRWTMEGAYGLPFFGDRFTGSPHAGVRLATGQREYSLGWRVTPARNAPELSFGLKATRRENDGAAPEHAIGFEATARW